MLKAGDHVLCIDPAPPRLLKGHEYLVKEVTANHVKVAGHSMFWRKNRFFVPEPLDPMAQDLVEEYRSNVPDRRLG